MARVSTELERIAVVYSYAIAIILYEPNKDVLKKIRNYEKTFDRILITDNTENQNKLIEEIKAEVKVIYHSMGSNTGVSGALNYIFKWAINEKIDFILTMDQDTFYPAKEIDNMIRFIEADNGDAAIYSANYAKTYVREGKKVPGVLSITRNEHKDVLFGMTSGSWMNIRYLPKILPLDNWFIGFVDYDICAAIKTNYGDARIVRVGNSVMYQQVGESLKDNFINQTFHVVHLSNQRYYYMMRNIELFKKKYKNSKEYISIADKQKLRIIFNILFENEKAKKIDAVKRGLKEGKSGL